jgi:hypothetical protein
VDEATQQQKQEVAKQAAAAAAAAVAAAPEAVVPAALKQLEKPEDEKYTVHVPEGLTVLDLDIIKLTAQMTARNGKNFLQVGAAAGGDLWWEHGWCCYSDASRGAVGRKHAVPRLLQAGLVHAVLQVLHSDGAADGSAGPCSCAASSHIHGDAQPQAQRTGLVASASLEAVAVTHHQLTLSPPPHCTCAEPRPSQACILPLHPPHSMPHHASHPLHPSPPPTSPTRPPHRAASTHHTTPHHTTPHHTTPHHTTPHHTTPHHTTPHHTHLPLPTHTTPTGPGHARGHQPPVLLHQAHP